MSNIVKLSAREDPSIALGRGVQVESRKSDVLAKRLFLSSFRNLESDVGTF